MKRELTEMEMFRAQELLMQRATIGLSAHEAAELAALGADDDISFDLAAAAIDLATLRIEEMPAGVADKVLLAANVGLMEGASDTTVMPAVSGVPQTLAGFVPPRPINTGSQPAQPPPQPTPPPIAEQPPVIDRPAPDIIPIDAARLRRRARIATTIAVLGFAAAAAAIVYVQVKQPTGTEVASEKSLAEQRAEWMAAAKDVTTLEWTATEDPNAVGAKGDVVWSKAEQKGFMRFTGLAVNDATKIQYQLWIFDKNRPQETPVDGGVFDVSSTGEVIVPITAKLSVDEPVLFAVTIEKPGGVVVSKRERIVVTAAPPKTG
ncbi:MAG: anti-sigma factor [Kofleriaceae bacterium]